jgi:hypothetical protein
MKIAVLFGGQLRTGVETSNSVLNFLGEYLPYCDFFVHTWDITTYKKGDYHGSHAKTFNWDAIKLKKEYLDEFLNIYKPLKFELTPFLQFRKEIEETDDYLMPPWAYSFWKSNELKKEYEIENNFKYDYVIKLRGDLIFWPDFTVKPIFERVFDKKLPMYHLEDMFYLSTSEGMDIMSSIGHPTNGILLENFKKDWPEDINKRIVEFVQETFECIPKFDMGRNSGYFLLRNEAKHLSYKQMNEMFSIFKNYYNTLQKKI